MYTHRLFVKVGGFFLIEITDKIKKSKQISQSEKSKMVSSTYMYTVVILLYLSLLTILWVFFFVNNFNTLHRKFQFSLSFFVKRPSERLFKISTPYQKLLLKFQPNLAHNFFNDGDFKEGVLSGFLT